MCGTMDNSPFQRKGELADLPAIIYENPAWYMWHNTHLYEMREISLGYCLASDSYIPNGMCVVGFYYV